jgi:hypothetical protein
MSAARSDALDDEARSQVAHELARYRSALKEVGVTDRIAFLAETKRHLARVDEILAEHSRRVGIDPPRARREGA